MRGADDEVSQEISSMDACKIADGEFDDDGRSKRTGIDHLISSLLIIYPKPKHATFLFIYDEYIMHACIILRCLKLQLLFLYS